jgi:hypothetical protein
LTFQTFDLTGFTNVTSVSWEQDASPSEGVHQFGNIHLFTATAVPEPATLAPAGLAVVVALGCAWRKRRRGLE